jgi:hypothetical protein
LKFGGKKITFLCRYGMGGWGRRRRRILRDFKDNISSRQAMPASIKE